MRRARLLHVYLDRIASYVQAGAKVKLNPER
jgi:hypothetical protein